VVERTAGGTRLPKLVTLASPFRLVIHPIVDYVLRWRRRIRSGRWRGDCIDGGTALYHYFLHNQRADILTALLLVAGMSASILLMCLVFEGVEASCQLSAISHQSSVISKCKLSSLSSFTLSNRRGASGGLLFYFLGASFSFSGRGGLGAVSSVSSACSVEWGQANFG